MDARGSLAAPPVEFGGYALKGELGHGASGRVPRGANAESSHSRGRGGLNGGVFTEGFVWWV